MTEDEQALDNFQASIVSLPDSDRIRILNSLIGILRTEIDSLDSGWEQMNFYDDAGNFRKEQVFMGLLERGTMKRTYQKIIDILTQFIHPEKEGQ